MTSWTSQELANVGDGEELAIASRRPDGTLGRFVTIWVVRAPAASSSYGPSTGDPARGSGAPGGWRGPDPGRRRRA
jgi:hypothetical protein